MSRFVSGGTAEQPTQRSEEWLKAQRAIEAKQLEQKLQAQQGEGKSLYETLQANKAAKEDAFQESIRLKNQFRALDEDEIDFLDAVNAASRSKEDAVRRETAEELRRFREQQQKSERATATGTSSSGSATGTEEARQRGVEGAEDGDEARESWAVSRKRKRERTAAVPGVKLRKASSSAAAAAATEEDGMKAAVFQTKDDSKASPRAASTAAATKTASPAAPPAPSLGLAGYSSDED